MEIIFFMFFIILALNPNISGYSRVSGGEDIFGLIRKSDVNIQCFGSVRCLTGSESRILKKSGSPPSRLRNQTNPGCKQN